MDRLEKLIWAVASVVMLAVVLFVATGPHAGHDSGDGRSGDGRLARPSGMAREGGPEARRHRVAVEGPATEAPCEACSAPSGNVAAEGTHADHDPACTVSAGGVGVVAPGHGPAVAARGPEVHAGRAGRAEASPAKGDAVRPDPAKQVRAERKDAREMQRPVGRFDIWTHGAAWHGVLTLGAGDEPSFINFGYHHQGYSREDVKDIQWDGAARLLTFAREFAPRIWQGYKLVFQPDLTFEGRYDSDFDCKGGPRADADFSPVPLGLYDLVCAENASRAHLRISGNDPSKLEATVNYGLFHEGFDTEQLRDVKWDAVNHTLSFFRPGHNQWTWLTFRENGRAFYGTFTVSPGTYWSLSGTRL